MAGKPKKSLRVWAFPMNAAYAACCFVLALMLAAGSAAETGHVVTVEDGVIEGGAGEGVLEELSREGLSPKTLVLGIDDQYVHQGKPDLLMHDLGLDAADIADSVRTLLGESR